MKRFLNIFLILLCFFSTLISDSIQNIRWAADEYIDESRRAGLSSPFLYIKEYTWPSDLVRLWHGYSDFKNGFEHLHWWCERSFSKNIAYYSEEINKSLKVDEITRYQNNIQNMRAKQVLVQNILNNGWDSVQARLSNYYRKLESSNPIDHFQKGMLYFDEGHVIEAVDQIKKLIDSGETQKVLEQFKTESSNFQLTLADGFIETCQYEEAISCLNEIIKNDPTNQEAFLQRSIAYFEKGSFNQSLEDYLASGFHSTPIDPFLPQDTLMAAGLSRGIISGGMEGLIEFVPSMLGSLHGLGHGLWAFAQEPIQISKECVHAVNACIEYIKTHSTLDVLSAVAPEFTHLINEWEIIDDYKRGELAGNRSRG